MGNVYTASVIATVMMVGGILAGLLLPKTRKLLKNNILVVSFTFVVMAFWAFSIAHNLTVTFIAVIHIGLGMGTYVPSRMTKIPEIVQPAAIAIALSIFMSASSFGAFINPFIITTSAALINQSVSTSFFLIAIIATLCI